MLRAFSLLRTPLRSFPQSLTSVAQFSSHFYKTRIPFGDPVDPPYPFPLNPPSISISSSSFLYSPSRHKHGSSYEDKSLYNKDSTSPPRLLVVQPRLRAQTLLQAKLDEALNLANSLEEQRDGYFDTEFCEKELPPHVVVQNPLARSPKGHADTYFGLGTVETVKCHLNVVESKSGLDAVFVNAILSGVQQRNLERGWGKPVLDRVGLIIEIFNAHAYTKEAKLQAELAALIYKKSRLVRIRGPNGRYTFGATGEAEVVSARGRGSGGRGFISGAGETELQLQRRRILERRNRLLSQIEEVRRTRALQRAARRRHGSSDGRSLATVAVVGYTNAGKSTLVSALSDTYMYSDDRLFATVDPRLRSVVLPSGRKVLLSDTVGFISDLPVQLVEAFHATLEEVVEADLLVHVIDSSAPNLDEQRAAVLQVLDQIGVSEDKIQSMIEVWNKIDLQEEGICTDEYVDYGEDDEAGNYSGAEANDATSELSPGETVDDEDNDNTASDSWGDVIETMGGQQGDDSESWLSTGDDQEIVDDQGDSSLCWKTTDDKESQYSEDGRMIEKVCHSQPEPVPHIKTSAIMGVGLQELLTLIDEKLENEKASKTGVFDKKWRPPQTKDTGIVVEQ
ncbi:GTP-binding protein At3g49725, chloroplastic [Malania oleifera]|uniref:GTP-binding protein At3g49725, chloroplastic n=1 Tax=Malania oleifera TaxID=397392 RepID=UPI0025AEC4CF|nr:GTP-binding protein At3g49725, chloroplastic [Malania oleifera]